MKIRDYLEERGISASKFAKKIKISSVTMCGILDGEKDMFLSVALKICNETGGKVKPQELLEQKIWEKTKLKIKS